MKNKKIATFEMCEEPMNKRKKYFLIILVSMYILMFLFFIAAVM